MMPTGKKELGQESVSALDILSSTSRIASRRVGMTSRQGSVLSGVCFLIVAVVLLSFGILAFSRSTRGVVCYEAARAALGWNEACMDLGFISRATRRSAAWRLFREAADCGDSTSQGIVGLVYLTGESNPFGFDGVERDPSLFIKYAEMAAKGGDVVSQINLGWALMGGPDLDLERGVVTHDPAFRNRVDLDSAYEWLVKASAGEPQAGGDYGKFNLAYLYTLSEFKGHNLTKAKDLFRTCEKSSIDEVRKRASWCLKNRF